MSLKEAIRERAAELGFDACRFASADPPRTGPALARWLESGQHGEMGYLKRNAGKRLDPELVLPGAASCVSVALSYHSVAEGAADGLSKRDEAAARGVVARYARFDDYHEILGARLETLTRWLDDRALPVRRSLWYTDTGPILEREFAERAGLGFVGKHTNVVSRRLGNWFLIGEILTTVSIEPDVPEKNRCGSCERCLSACPTQAITAPFRLDARRCISYLTIELKGAIPLEFRRSIGNRVFGCDDCLAACPWNRFAREGGAMKERERSDLAVVDLLELLALDDAQFKSRFHGTPLARSKRRGLLRNVCVALGNVGDSRALPALARASADSDAIIAEHALWAIREIEDRTPGAEPRP
ncbi:MAG: tRNA epoxyqueuosine(34) reductase QueG [Verrucomicrobia bacterium]|nr:tRNA epoxyqueuosine(34) reductase QueG [Verrucomicrobiota bacterium]